MDLVPPVQKNVVRIRTFKDDLLRAQGNTQKVETVTGATSSQPIKATSGIRVVENSLSQKNYTPLPNPQQTSAPLPQGERPAQQQTTLIKSASSAPQKTTYQARQALGATLTQEDIAKITHVQKSSILSDEGRLPSDDSLGEGMIVRDKKRKRFKLLPAIGMAISSWFSDTKTEYQKVVNGPVHTVAKAESRLETIRKAIEQSRQAPKDDFSQVAATLKTTERTQIQSAILVKDKSELPQPTWSHVVGEPDAPVLQEETTIIEKPEPQVVAATVIQTAPVPETPQQAVSIEVLQQPIEPAYEEVVEEEPVQVQAEEVAAAVPAQNTPVRYAPARTPSEKPFYIVLASIVFIATMLGVGVSYYFFGGANTGVTIKDEIAYEAPTLFSAGSTLNFLLPEDRLTLLSVLTAGIEENSDSVVHLYPTLDEEGTPADIGSILGTLGLRADGSFIRGIREIAFGGSSGEPFIVLTTASFDTAFAGMLGFEESMSADLSPLFGSPVSSSYNPEVRTDTQTSSAYFKDIIASNKNARLLVDENGDDRIVYTFIDKNTIVITTTREVLADVIPLVD
jgi:hypothetical protein